MTGNPNNLFGTPPTPEGWSCPCSAGRPDWTPDKGPHAEWCPSRDAIPQPPQTTLLTNPPELLDDYFTHRLNTLIRDLSAHLRASPAETRLLLIRALTTPPNDPVPTPSPTPSQPGPRASSSHPVPRPPSPTEGDGVRGTRSPRPSTPSPSPSGVNIPGAGWIE